MLEVIEDCCSPYYLEMMKQSAISSSSWNMKYPTGKPFEDKHLKLDIIDNEVKEPLLAGMAMGLLINIWSKRQDLFQPEVSYCSISMKDRHREDNLHRDHVKDLDYIKILGLLNSDWESKDGGLFIYGDEVVPMKPCLFAVFDPRVLHSASEIFSDKKRLGIDFTVKKVNR